MSTPSVPTSDPVSPPQMPSASPKHTSKPQPAATDISVGRFRFSKVFSRWWWLAAIFIVLVTYLVAMTPKWMGVSGPLYESTALIEVKPIVDVDAYASLPAATGTAVGTGTGEFRMRQFIHTQFEIIVTTKTLKLALAKNNLLSRLGGKEDEAIERMRKSIRTSQRRGTDLVEIGYRDEDAELAYDGAVAVYEAYKERRAELELSMRREQLRAIQVELMNKSDRVAELRKRLMDVAEKVGLIYMETEGGKIQQFPGADLREKTEKELFEAEMRKKKLTVLINKLLSAENDHSMLLTIDLPDVDIKEYYQKYDEALKELAAMKSSGLAEKHPDMVMRRARLLEMEKSLKKRVVNVRQSLKHQLEIVELRIKKMKVVADGLQDDGIQKARAMQEMNVVRKEYERARENWEELQEKNDLEKVRLVMRTNSVIVHEKPERSSRLVTRGREFYAALGTVCSLPFSIGLGILLMYFAEMMKPRRG